jgi:tetratricopeptide (TPR) repeat protein
MGTSTSPVRPRWKPVTLALLALLLGAGTAPESSGFAKAVAAAEAALQKGDLATARAQVERALERDPKSVRAWELRVHWAELANEPDEAVYALHRVYALSVAQQVEKKALADLRARITGADPIAADLFGLEAKYVKKLGEVAAAFEKLGWPHSAIATHREILALDPENVASRTAIEKLASAPDPSLAGDARPADLLAGISDEWIAEHDRAHATWEERATLEHEHYVTHTDAGYAVLVRAAAAMDQMSDFYREFFAFGTGKDARTAPRIELRIFKDQDEYLRLGQSPAKWSGGQFTGDAVETYVGAGGFAEMVGTLFHEAAHQYVSLATNAAGWLNEGLASFFEGSRLLANGTVRTNLPANHRLFPLAERMERGWMVSATDGAAPGDPTVVPPKAPTFRIVLENAYEWGPAWYEPTWGVVYFLYNFQDPRDGRFLYRKAFREYVDKSGGLLGETAVEVFEETVLARASDPTPGIKSSLTLPTSVGQLDETWKEWILKLRDEQSGRLKFLRPWKEWATFAIQRGDADTALEFFEKGLDAAPEDPQLLIAFGTFLAGEKREDRAVQLFRRAEALLAAESGPDALLAADADRWLRKLDPQVFPLRKVRAGLVPEAQGIAQRYFDQGFELQAMDVAWRLGTELSIPGLLDLYRRAVEREGRSLATWKLAYDEQGLAGWSAEGDTVFRPAGEELTASFGAWQTDEFSYRFLTLDEVTSGDFSLEAEVLAKPREVAFAGLVFGRKSTDDFHALLFYPPTTEGKNGYTDLATFYGGGSHETWHHVSVPSTGPDPWVKMRIDVTGRRVEMWLAGSAIGSQEFPGKEVLRGSFGLATGVGTARFRNVRYLARDARDPAAEIERAARTSGEPIARGGSWVGLAPPFPSASRWVQEPRTSWDEGRGSPQLLVLWSCAQNEIVRIDEWLRAFAAKYADLGLRIVSVVEYSDEARLADYLGEHAFPGSLGIDLRQDPPSIGATFETFAVQQFGLPRVLLVDVDGKVAWEGEPGLKSGKAWSGEDTYVDAPLRDLAERRKLRELAGWRARWSSEGRPAVAAGNLAQALPLLREAEQLDGSLFPDVAEAQAMLRAIVDTARAPETALAALATARREPALAALKRWAELAGAPLAESKEVKAMAKCASVKAWERALGFLKPALRKIGEGKPAEVSLTVVEEIAKLEGAFVEELATDLREAAGDPERLESVLVGAESRPARWLAREHFGW